MVMLNYNRWKIKSIGIVIITIIIITTATIIIIIIQTFKQIKLVDIIQINNKCGSKTWILGIIKWKWCSNKSTYNKCKCNNNKCKTYKIKWSIATIINNGMVNQMIHRIKIKIKTNN